jgi:hypothetical protein
MIDSEGSILAWEGVIKVLGYPIHIQPGQIIYCLVCRHPPLAGGRKPSCKGGSDTL